MSESERPGHFRRWEANTVARSHEEGAPAALPLGMESRVESEQPLEKGCTVTSKADFTEEEWVKLYRAPLVAGMGVSLADIGGPIEMSKESLAAMKTAVTPTEEQGLVVDLSAGLKVALDEKQNPLSDLKPESGADPRQLILDELREANRIVSEKASSEEASGYRAWVLQSARNAADAAKEGGFFGIGAVQMSEGEQQILAKLEELLGDSSV
jgi:hypothetical protein